MNITGYVSMHFKQPNVTSSSHIFTLPFLFLQGFLTICFGIMKLGEEIFVLCGQINTHFAAFYSTVFSLYSGLQLGEKKRDQIIVSPPSFHLLPRFFFLMEQMYMGTNNDELRWKQYENMLLIIEEK